MAPEILDSSGYSFQVDWWALGIIIFEMLTGMPPFFEEDQNKMFDKISKGKLEFPKSVKMSKNCKDLIQKLLHKDPKKRLGSKGYE